jgi:hypothetical protein
VTAADWPVVVPETVAENVCVPETWSDALSGDTAIDRVWLPPEDTLAPELTVFEAQA